MDLPTVWFFLIATLWLGYFFLEGFDFGVGMLLGIGTRDEKERRVLINTIGPVWDGNEVWVIVAVGATFAAFPDWYAALLSGAYLPVLFVLLSLIGRGVAFEYRGKVDGVRWRRNWDRVIQIGSWLPPLGWGFIITATVTGLPIDVNGDLRGGLIDLVRVETLLGALALAGFSLLHGAVFLALKTDGDIRWRMQRFASRYGALLLLPGAALLAIVQFRHGAAWTAVIAGVAVLASIGALLLLPRGRAGRAFTLLGVMLAAVVVVLFGSLYPNVMPSTIDSMFTLTVAGAASSPYTLSVITWVAAFGTPAVLLYQGWTYWVFRRRISTAHIPAVRVP
ncbi:cytochrome d ubiquinol oxidase subunit II [Actinoalloteichus hoggarensis]|uniref:Cytochrome bd-I ubiquinol oxidase subunit 2 n=1 Tax=Actinoalloteichus hoggarensis TaxID=1470176 RepID=A0A221VX06_9PSEU|nr:cytochrome d ubiquinol oxidase subunit II [Actinoalloteichus hoggarensis]ASO17781.1 Cytochrome bd-I ubiquinol oxidase subunit 2 [Actinoalloteichus hoggarensis]MBB5922908.1 cytochrome d ubiquinol oxidase subunit II [Actinoalloteichus hoggarensis]